MDFVTLRSMTAARLPVKHFLLHSLWVVLPFCALLALTWNAWRADADTRRSRVLDSAGQAAARMLAGVDGELGAWSPLPKRDGVGTPPMPNDDPAAQAARARYEAGDFEGVLGSPESLRSSAGVPLRLLAALQLLRKETDPARLAELAGILTNSMSFITPSLMGEAEHRFAELKLPQAPALAGWREKWRRAEVESTLAREIREPASAVWNACDGNSFLIETTRNGREWRVRSEAEVKAAVSRAVARDASSLADGLVLSISVAGKHLAGPVGTSSLLQSNRNAWNAGVVLADESAFLRGDARTRNFMTGVVAVAGLALLFGLIQAGRAYLRAVELARRQSEFMAAVSHEMRTPLAAMRLLAENLESGVAERAGQRAEHTKLIRRECARLGDLVDNVLAFTRTRRAEPYEAFGVGAMMDDVASLVKPMAAERNIRFDAASADFPEAPRGDAAALRRALLNLLDNALKHTPAGGSVSCRCQPLDGNRWSIEVTDSGPGIPEEERVRIFEPFYRIGDELRRSTPGTGLGLALVKRCAGAHGGRIEVDDAPGGGSRFRLTLPIHPPAP
jgi:signal transduction histidine kinase